MNKKILASLACGLAIAACNGGGGSGGTTNLASGNYQFSTWDAPSSGVCSQSVPSGVVPVQATVGSNGQLCLTGQQNGICFNVNTSAPTNCVSGSNNVVFLATGQNTTLTVSSSNCNYTNNILSGNVQPVYSPAVPTGPVPPQCFNISSGTVSSTNNSEVKEGATAASFSLSKITK